MKSKITYLLLILPFLTFAQGPWEFNTATNTEGWTAWQGTVSAGATDPQTSRTVSVSNGIISFTTANGSSTVYRNPLLKNSAANMDGVTYNAVEIKVKNGTAATLLKVNADGTLVYIPIIATDSGFRVYQILLNTAATIASLSFEFRNSASGDPTGTNYNPAAGLMIEVDYIRPVNYIPTVRNVFNFDTTLDVEGFTTLTRATAAQLTESRGTLKINCTTANANNGKVSLSPIVFGVEGTNKYAHITLKNTSTNTLFQINGKVAGVGTPFNPIQTYTPSDTDYKTYHFDLTTWDNGYQYPELNFGVKETWLATATYATGDIVISGNTYCKNTSGTNSVSPAVPHTDVANWVIVNATGAIADATPATNGAIVGGALNINALTNSVYVDSIVFDNTLSTVDFGNTNNTISLYPNPTKEVLNISSFNNISKIEVYDLLGKKVASNNNASDVNVAALGKGAYIVKVVQENGSVVAKQFIKE